MKSYRKYDFPVDEIRRFMEPGPVVLVSSAWKDKKNIMTMGWHTVMGFSPSLIGCYIWDENYSYEIIKKSSECVFNVPTVDLARIAVGIGNCSGAEVDKFAEFGLTPLPARKVKAPLIKECYANLECKLVEGRMIRLYSFFIFEVVKAHAPHKPVYPETFHYRGNGQFMLSGKNLNLKKGFKPDRL